MLNVASTQTGTPRPPRMWCTTSVMVVHHILGGTRGVFAGYLPGYFVSGQWAVGSGQQAARRWGPCFVGAALPARARVGWSA